MTQPTPERMAEIRAWEAGDCTIHRERALLNMRRELLAKIDELEAELAAIKLHYPDWVNLLCGNAVERAATTHDTDRRAFAVRVLQEAARRAAEPVAEKPAFLLRRLMDQTERGEWPPKAP